MNESTLVKELNEVLHNAILLADPKTPIRALSERVIEENRELIDELTVEWRIGFVARLLRQKQNQIAREQRTAQLMLPGFERLPTSITLPEGKRRPLEQATYRQLVSYLAVLRRRQANNPRITQVRALMDLMKKWRKKLRKKSYGLTVAEVMQREAGLL